MTNQNNRMDNNDFRNGSGFMRIGGNHKTVRANLELEPILQANLPVTFFLVLE